MCDPREFNYANAYEQTTKTETPDFSQMLGDLHRWKVKKDHEIEMHMELIKQNADLQMLEIKRRAYIDHYSLHTDLLSDIADVYLKMEDELNNIDEGNEDFYSQHQNIVDEIFLQFKKINEKQKLFDGDLDELHENGIPYICRIKNHS